MFVKSNRAVTLIELLVVVLIIGIVSAIAIPQYKKAVVKAQLTQFMTMYGAYRQAMDVYLLANSWPSKETFFTGNGNGVSNTYDFSSLDVSYPVVNQSEYYDEIVIAGQHAAVLANIYPDSIYFNLAGVGTNKYLQGCGLGFGKRPDSPDWYLGAFTKHNGAFGTNYDYSTSASECPEVKKLMCQYWKTNGTGLFRPTAASACTAVGVAVTANA